ncbi:hypothetical protein A9179_07610 [Pseudomonas alcaligenes]|uniref:Uncharacterized protein n=1 Tax=Aquipseudomonas alcaligenes TaxID=43263 RepID=A0ABR7RXR4_AQUAC|nr:hypothetical protein [Pseudomonas alcaligenes]MBC9250137.1 hypothetical protein [Pseudomonas alcaligenes]
MMSSDESPNAFARQLAALRLRVGDEALDVRHEVFFLAVRYGRGAGLRGCVALLRDAWLLLRCPAPGRQPLADGLMLVVTLAGQSGWGTLARSLPLLAPGSPVILAHPRLAACDFAQGVPVRRPLRPSLKAIGSAASTFCRVLLTQRSLLLASCLARRALWRASLARTLSGRCGPLILHNDFDMMSNAAIGQAGATVCLQHGVPTEEFFPIRADWYVVWGERSRQAFIDAGSAVPRLVEDALGRAPAPSAPEAAPDGISLLSQAHAPILGNELAGWLHQFALRLLQAEPALRILLHPQEHTAYPGAAALACSRPPHAELAAAATPCLVLGCCSSALFDAALAGHWVVRLAAPLAGNRAALHLLEGLPCAESAEQVLRLYERLRTDVAFRRETALAQLSWLKENFAAETGALARLLARLEDEAHA